MNIFAERITKLRKDHGLSQADVAKKIGVTQANIYKYEKGLSEPPYKTAKWYADYFDISLDYLFGRTDNPAGKMNFLLSEDEKKNMEISFQSMVRPGTKTYEDFKKAVIKIIDEEKGRD